MTPSPDHGTWDLDGLVAFWVRLDGPVLSKSNHRHSRAGERAGQWRRLAGFEEAVTLQLRAARPAAWQTQWNDPVVANRPRVVAVVSACTMLDAGNVSKSLLDAGQGIVMGTDAEVASVCETVQRSRTNPGAVLAFAQLPAGSDSDAVLRAQILLMQSVHDLAPFGQ